MAETPKITVCTTYRYSYLKPVGCEVHLPEGFPDCSTFTNEIDTLRCENLVLKHLVKNMPDIVCTEARQTEETAELCSDPQPTTEEATSSLLKKLRFIRNTFPSGSVFLGETGERTIRRVKP